MWKNVSLAKYTWVLVCRKVRKKWWIEPGICPIEAFNQQNFSEKCPLQFNIYKPNFAPSKVKAGNNVALSLHLNSYTVKNLRSTLSHEIDPWWLSNSWMCRALILVVSFRDSIFMQRIKNKWFINVVNLSFSVIFKGIHSWQKHAMFNIIAIVVRPWLEME